jgi:hypothetical protein
MVKVTNMKKSTIAKKLSKVFSNGRDSKTLQTCVPKPIGEKSGMKPGSHLAWDVALQDQTVRVKKGTVFVHVIADDLFVEKVV